MSIDEPTFTYDAAKPLTEQQKRDLEEARRNPPPLKVAEAKDPRCLRRCSDGLHEFGCVVAAHEERQARLAIMEEARAHQWEHKASIGGVADAKRLADAHAAGVAAVRSTFGQARTFTREEVLTVIRTLKASWQVHGSEDYDNGAKRAFADMAATIANME